MKRRRAAVVVAMVGLASSVVAPAATAQPGPAWGPCPADVKTEAVVLECATIPVPLNYSDPGGEQIELVVSRLASKNPAKRRGVLMLNPGGPGGSGLAFPDFLASRGMPDSVLDSYDVIGMDTRGIGDSAPVSCGFTPDQAYLGNIPPYAVDEAEVAEQAELAKGVAEQCAAHDGDGRLRHLSTANMARDLDSVRAALGEERTSFLGYSYGSALGAAYASMFPERSDRVVVDSNLADTHLDRDALRRYALGFEETFPDFATWVAARHDAYGLGRTPEEVRETYFRTAERLDEAPVNGIDGRVFRLATFVGLYGETAYGRTAQTWQSLLAGEEAPQPAAAADAPPTDNPWSVFLGVTCNDVDWPSDVGTYQRAVAEDRERYPMYGAASANISPCAFWGDPAEPPVVIDDQGPANVLVLQNRRDPVTPHRNAEILDEKFGDRSRLVSVEGSGHGVYLMGGNACALNTTTDFLVEGRLPEEDTACR